MTFGGSAFVLAYVIGIACSLFLALRARRLRPDVTLALGTVAVLAAGIATGIAMRGTWPRAGEPSADPAFGFVAWAPLLLLTLSALTASSQGRAASYAYGVTFAVALAVGYGVTAGGANAALPLHAADVAVPAPATALGASDVARARAAVASGLVAIDLADRAPAGKRQLVGLKLGARDALGVAGWAVDEDTGTPCEAVGVVVDGRRIVQASYGLARVDVAQYFHDSGRTNVGYSAQVPASWIGEGRHVAAIVCEGNAGRFRRSAREIGFTVEAGK